MLAGSGTVTFEFRQGAVTTDTVLYDFKTDTWEHRSETGSGIQSGTSADITLAIDAMFHKALLKNGTAANAWAGFADELDDARSVATTALSPAWSGLSLSGVQGGQGLFPAGTGTSYTSSASPISGVSTLREALQLAAGLVPIAVGVILIVRMHRKRRRVLAPVAASLA